MHPNLLRRIQTKISKSSIKKILKTPQPPLTITLLPLRLVPTRKHQTSQKKWFWKRRLLICWHYSLLMLRVIPPQCLQYLDHQLLPQLMPPLQMLPKRKGKREKQLRALKKKRSPILRNNCQPKRLVIQRPIKRNVLLLGPAKAPKESNVLNRPYGILPLYSAQETP